MIRYMKAHPRNGAFGSGWVWFLLYTGWGTIGVGIRGTHGKTKDLINLCFEGT